MDRPQARQFRYATSAAPHRGGASIGGVVLRVFVSAGGATPRGVPQRVLDGAGGAAPRGVEDRRLGAGRTALVLGDVLVIHLLTPCEAHEKAYPIARRPPARRVIRRTR